MLGVSLCVWLALPVWLAVNVEVIEGVAVVLVDCDCDGVDDCEDVDVELMVCEGVLEVVVLCEDVDDELLDPVWLND